MAKPMASLIQKFIDYTSAKGAYFFGLIPYLHVLLALAVVSAAIVGATLLLSSAAAILPVMATTVGVAFVNFWFSREIQSVTLGLTPASYKKNENGKEVIVDWTYNFGLSENYNFSRAMDHLRGVINARYPNDTPLPPIRLGTFSEAHHKLVIAGRNPGKAMIAIANFGTFELFAGKPREFNALMLQALAQIKLRSTFSGMLVAVVVDFGQTLKQFKHHEFLPLQILGALTAPFGQLLMNAMSRTNTYYRADKIVAECGYGEDLIKALETLNQPANMTAVPRSNDSEALPEVTGFFARPRNYINKLVHEESLPREDKTGYTLLQALDNGVLHFGRFFKELFSSSPRMGNRIAAISAHMSELNLGIKILPAESLRYHLCLDHKIAEILKSEPGHGAHSHAHGHSHGCRQASQPSVPVLMSGGPAACSPVKENNQRRLDSLVIKSPRPRSRSA